MCPNRTPRVDVRCPLRCVAPAAQSLGADLPSPERTASFPCLRMESMARDARSFAGMGRPSRARVPFSELVAGSAHGEGPTLRSAGLMDGMAPLATREGVIAALPGIPAGKRMPSFPRRRIDRSMASAAEAAPRVAKEGFPGPAMRRVAIPASHLSHPAGVHRSGDSGLFRVTPGADGVPPLPQGNSGSCEYSPPPLHVGGVAPRTRVFPSFSRRQGGMLGPLPKDGPAVLDRTVVTAVADPFLVELLQVPGRQEGRVEKDAFADVAEGAVLLVERGSGGPGAFEQEGQQDRDGENAPFQPATARMIRRRSPS